MADFCRIAQSVFRVESTAASVFALIADGGLGSPAFEAGLRMAGEAVASGAEDTNAGALALCGLFPPDFIELIGASEQAEAPGEVFGRLAADYADDAKTGAEIMGTVLKVVAFLVVAGLHSAVTVATYGAMFRVMPMFLKGI